ncbi:MAG: hypothetical protein LBQ78_04320 [Tannerellaceae bacterium]|nr:hypothetical protein [Tannerellaceae bacterium]
MGLFFRESKEVRAAVKRYIGSQVTCRICGRKYYELKAASIPVALIGKYRPAVVSRCEKCGQVYCMGGGFLSCMMKLSSQGGCSCSTGQVISIVIGNYVEKIK